jgi:hypothetical protein
VCFLDWNQSLYQCTQICCLIRPTSACLVFKNENVFQLRPSLFISANGFQSCPGIMSTYLKDNSDPIIVIMENTVIVLIVASYQNLNSYAVFHFCTYKYIIYIITYIFCILPDLLVYGSHFISHFVMSKRKIMLLSFDKFLKHTDCRT